MGVKGVNLIVFLLLAPLVASCAKKYSARDVDWGFSQSQDESVATIVNPLATERLDGEIPTEFYSMVEQTERAIFMGKRQGPTTEALKIEGPQGNAPVTLYNSTACYPSTMEAKVTAPTDSTVLAVVTPISTRGGGKLESKGAAPFSAEKSASKFFTFAGKTAGRFLIYLVGLDPQKATTRSNSIGVKVRDCVPGGTLEITPPVVYDDAACEPHATNFYVREGAPGAPFVSVLTSPSGEKSEGSRDLSATGTAESTAYSTVGLATGTYTMEVWVSDLAGGYRSTNTASFTVKKCSK